MSRRVHHQFAATSRAPSAARDSFAAALVMAYRDPPGRAAADAALIVSELVTNAVRAGSATVSVTLEHIAGALAVQVRDDAAGWPEQRAAGVDDPGGRGLPLVSAISRRWGVRMARGGKVVWAELPLAAS